jgi:hypothetical protein
MNVIYTELYNGIQVWHLLAGFGVLVLLTAVWNRLERFRSLKNSKNHMVAKSCDACGWNGKTGSHVRNCPRCNARV